MDRPATEAGTQIDRALDRLIRDGEMAVVILDEDLVAIEAAGLLAAAVPIGAPIDEGLPYLAGLAPDLLNMQDEPGAGFLLSNVGIAGTAKVNIEAFWQAEDRRYCLLIHKLGLRTAPEAEIIKQIKSRRIAEQHLQQTRQALAERTALTDVLADTAPFALAVVDRDHRYVFATRAWQDLFGLGPDPIAGQSFLDSPAAHRAFETQAVARGLAGQTIQDQDTVIHMTGRELHLVTSVVPWRRAGSPVQGALLVASPRDRERALAASLARQVEHLQTVNQLLEEVIAIAAHDLEAPRRAIDRALDPSGPLEPEVIAAHSQRIKSLLAELLEHARLAGGPESPQLVDIAAVAREALAVTERGDAFELALEPAAPSVAALKLPLETIVRNLVANAVRHHDKGHGTIALELEDLRTVWRLSVSDDGPGIAPAGRNMVFEAFQQLEAGATRGGAGLGLALTASAARRLGGEISVRDRPDGRRGACFTLVWPKGTEG